MDDFDAALEEAEVHLGPACGLRGQVSRLSDVQQAKVWRHISNEDGPSLAKLVRALKSMGITTTTGTVRRHRVGECTHCAARP